MNYRTFSQRRQKVANYECVSFDAFVCQETIDPRSYRKQSWKATWIIDMKRGKHYWSSEFYEMMGIAPGIFPDVMFWVDYLQPDDLVTFTSCLDRIEEDGNSREFTFTLIQGDETKKIKCFMEEVKRFFSSEVDYIVGSCYDVSDGDFLQAAENVKKLQKENEINRQLLSIITHDFKNPLSSIIGLVQLLLQRNQVHNIEKTELYLRTILTGAQTAHTMMVRLMEWAKSQNENWKVVPVKLDLSVLITEIFDELKIIAGAKDIVLFNGCEKETFAFTDSEMTRIIIRNLVSNAIKFSFKGGEVFVTVIKTEEYIQLSVTDFGIGMEKTDQQKIFQSEIIEPGTGTANERGTGVGLSICQSLVERLGGRIWVQSDFGSGSTFYFTIPF